MTGKKKGFVKPMGDLEWEGPTWHQHEEDDKRFERILNFVPDAEILRPLVVACLEGYRAQFREHLQKNENRTWFERFKERFGHLFKNVNNADKDKFDKLVEDAEVSYAQQEIARYWADMFLLAWDICSEPSDGLALYDSLLPNLSKNPEVSAEWKKTSREAERSLRNAVALSEDNFDLVMRLFVNNVKRALQKVPVELPDGVDIALDKNNQPRLKARGR